jgi:hypothetical protein
MIIQTPFVIAFYSPTIVEHEHDMRVLSRIKGCEVRAGTAIDLLTLQRDLVDLFVVDETTPVRGFQAIHYGPPREIEKDRTDRNIRHLVKALTFAEYLRDPLGNHINHEAGLIILGSSCDARVRSFCARVEAKYVSKPLEENVLRERYILPYLPPAKR